MGHVQNDLDKRILAAFAAQNSSYRRAMNDDDVIGEMAAIWVASGGDAGGLDDEYVGKIRQRIQQMEREAV